MQAFPFLLETKLNYADANRTGTNFEVVNAGISGSTTSGGVSRIQWLLKSKPDLLIVALGQMMVCVEFLFLKSKKLERNYTCRPKK